MDPSAEKDQNAQVRAEERERLAQLPAFPPRGQDDEVGVLLSDRIKYYCLNYELIHPFDEQKLLKPAGYDLTVGHNYSIRDKRAALSEGRSFDIGPYQVAIVETRETLNMPPFLIGRWNIRVKRAYQGLLWVGGAQVDPGFRGRLCCPIYNLSNKPVSLKFGDELATIDFVTTTPFVKNWCKEFDWANRKMLVFDEYPMLESGIEDEVNSFKETIAQEKQNTKSLLVESKEKTDESLREVRSRIDQFLTLIFTVVAVLFTGLGIVATTTAPERSFVNPPVWVAGAALFFALRANRASSDDRKARGFAQNGPAIVVSVIALAVGIAAWVRPPTLESEIRARETAFNELKMQIQHLQERLNALEHKQSPTKP
jgi:deoxycytidine triphosphate deaminase